MEKLYVRPPFNGEVPPTIDFMIMDMKATTTEEVKRLRKVGRAPISHLKRVDLKQSKCMLHKGNVQIMMFGCTSEGHSITAIADYAPFVDVMVPYSLSALMSRTRGRVKPKQLFDTIESTVLDIDEDADLSYIVREAYPVFGFTSFSSQGARKERWLRISTKRAETFIALLSVLRSKAISKKILRQNGVNPDNAKYVNKLTLAFDKLGHDERFCSQKQVAPSGWVRMSSVRPLENNSLFTTQIQCHGFVEPLKEKKDIAPIVTISFDIECVPKHSNNFPKSHVPSDVIAQIGVTLGIHGKGIVKRAVICLGQTDPVDNDLDIVIISCATETEVLQYLKNIITHKLIDGDIITGYNIFDFDFMFCGDRAMRIEAFGQVTLPEAFDAWSSARDVSRIYKEFRAAHDENPPVSWNDKNIAAKKSRKILSDWVGYTDDGGNRFANMPHAMRMLLDYETPEELKEAYDEFSKIYDSRFAYNYCSRIRVERTVLETVILQSAALGSNELIRFDMTGRTSFDLFLHIKSNFKMNSYSLKSSCKKFLPDGQNKVDLPYKTMFEHWKSGDSKRRALVAEYCSMDCDLVVEIIDKAAIRVDLIEMSRFTFTPLPQLVTRGQQVKVYRQIAYYSNAWGFALNHIHVPPPSTYEGATVLPPKSQYYREPIATLDFQSLYPGIMRSHNLCFSSWIPPRILARARQMNIKINTFDVAGEQHSFVDDSMFQGLLPRLLSELHTERRKVKKEMKKFKYGTPEYFLLNAKQLAIKVTMNSVYGFCGVKTGKMPCYPISATTTCIGRQMIEDTKAFCEQHYDCDVIYGDSVAPWTPMILRIDGEIIIRRIADVARDLVFVRRNDGKETSEVPNMETLTSNGFVSVQRVIRHKTNKPLVRITTNKGMICVTEDHSMIKSDGTVVRPKNLLTGQSLLGSKLLLSVPNTRQTIPSFTVGPHRIRCSSELSRLMASALCNLADQRLFFTTSPGTHALIYNAARIVHGTVTWHENTQCVIGAGDDASLIRKFYQKECLNFPLLLLNGKFKSHQVEYVNHLILPMQIGDPCLALALRALIRVATRRCTDCFFRNGFYHLDYSDTQEVTIMEIDRDVHPSPEYVFDLTVPGKEQFDAFGISVHNTDSVMVRFRSWPPELLNVKTLVASKSEDGNCILFTVHMETPMTAEHLEQMGDSRFILSFSSHENVLLYDVSLSEHGIRARSSEKFAKEFGSSDDGSLLWRYESGVTLSMNKIIHPTKDGMKQAFDAGEHAADAVTNVLFELYPAKILEMEKAMLGALYYPEKKKYAQRAYEEKDGKPKWDFKGIPIVRRDNSAFMRNTLKAAITAAIPLEGDPLLHEDAANCFIAQIRAGLKLLVDRSIPLDDFTISKSLKRYSEYKNPGRMGHVVLWRKIIARIESGECVQAPPRAGDRLEYVVVEGKGKQYERCEDPDWIREKKREIMSKPTIGRPSLIIMSPDNPQQGGEEKLNPISYPIIKTTTYSEERGYLCHYRDGRNQKQQRWSKDPHWSIEWREEEYKSIEEYKNGLIKVKWMRNEWKACILPGWPTIDRVYYANILLKPAEDFIAVIGYSVKHIFKDFVDQITSQHSGTQKLDKYFAAAMLPRGYHEKSKAVDEKLVAKTKKKKRKKGEVPKGGTLSAFFPKEEGVKKPAKKMKTPTSKKRKPQSSSSSSSSNKKKGLMRFMNSN